MAPSAVLPQFREVVVADFEFATAAGERPDPICLVAYELKSGSRFRVWKNQFGSAPPYAAGPDVLFVAFYASAELGCYRVLGWPMPPRILDPSLNSETARTAYPCRAERASWARYRTSGWTP